MNEEEAKVFCNCDLSYMLSRAMTEIQHKLEAEMRRRGMRDPGVQFIINSMYWPDKAEDQCFVVMTHNAGLDIKDVRDTLQSKVEQLDREEPPVASYFPNAVSE